MGRGWEGDVWCPAAPLSYAGASDCPTLGHIPTLPRAQTWRSTSPPGWLLGPSHWVYFPSLQLSSGDSPVTHHTLSWVGATASCPHLPARRHPMSSAFENPDKGPARPGSPARGSGEQGPRPVFYVPLTCLSAVLPGAQGSLWASRQLAPAGCGLEEGAAWGRRVVDRGNAHPEQRNEMRYSGWTPLFPFPPPVHSPRVYRGPEMGSRCPRATEHTEGSWVLAALNLGLLGHNQMWCQGLPIRRIPGFSGCRCGTGLGINCLSSRARKPVGPQCWS